MTISNKKVKELLDEYKKDPVTFRLKYGSRAEADLLETAHKKGMTKEVEKKTAKHGGKMKKKHKYQDKGKVLKYLKQPTGIGTPETDEKFDEKLDEKLRAIGVSSGTPTTIEEAKAMGWKQAPYMLPSNPPVLIFTKNGKSVKIRAPMSKGQKEFFEKIPRPQKKGGRIKYQYGGMADMSAAPMVKQPQTKKRKASGFRTKYSKGGGVRSSKYKL